MKSDILCGLLCWLICAAQFARAADAQEASSGFDLKATLSAQAVTSNTLTDAPRNGAPGAAGFRGVAYPTWKIGNNWFVTGALQLATRPYFYSDFSTTGFGAKGEVLQASLNYSRLSANGSLLLRAGELSTAFGSFPLRYDDADNALVDLPIEYGYYYSPVSVAGIAGAEIDASRGRWDGRAQFANSSPSNPRSIFAHDQYGNWAGGAGYTIHQGFRVGVSGYHGPYLDRQSPFFFPGEANPNKTPAHALGADLSWARGHTSVQVEAQKFVFPYTAIPTFAELATYAEIKQVVSPRWYLAMRLGVTSARLPGQTRALECAAGYRPNRWQLLKIDYEIEHYDSGSPHNENTLAVQFVTTLHASAGRN
jgi:hypothetical protein